MTMAVQSFPNTRSTRWTQAKCYAQSVCALLMLVPFLISPVASQGQGAIGGPKCVENYDANVDYFPSHITVDNAALFKVRYEKNYKVVTNTAPGANKEYVLTMCGTPAPPASQFSNNTLFITVPVTNAATIATTSVAFIEMLGRRSALKVVDTEGLVSSPCVQYGLEHGEIIGLEDKNKTLRQDQFRSAEVVFSSYGAEPGTENKTIITSEVSDPGPLNRAEWLEFYSTFFNLEAPAQELTSTINNNYNCFQKAAKAQSTKPIIAWTSYVAPSAFNKNVASWVLSGAAYKKIISEDAGAQFFNGTTASTFATAEEFAAAVKDVDILIDESMTGDDMPAFLQNYKLSIDADLKFIKNKAIYRQDGLINPNDGRDWFASAVVMNDAVLQDIIRAVHPEVLPSNVQYNWIRNIARKEAKQVMTAKDCTTTDSNKPIPDRALVCKDMKAGGGNSAASKTMVGSLSAALALAVVALTL